MGRPSILTEELTEKFCSELRLSGSIESAITASGIGRVTYYRWRREVREHRGNKQKVKFMRAVEKAEGAVKLHRERMLSKHFDKDWRPVAWWLARKFPNEYGRRRRMHPLDPNALDPYAAPESSHVDRNERRRLAAAEKLKHTQPAEPPYDGPSVFLDDEPDLFAPETPFQSEKVKPTQPTAEPPYDGPSVILDDEPDPFAPAPPP